MDGTIDRFVNLILRNQNTLPDLVENGAYPFRTKNGGWEIPVSKIEPVLDSYFERTRTFTGNYDLDFDEVPQFILTNENEYPFVLSSIRNLGGVYFGVGAALGFTFAAVQGASHAFMADINAGVPFGAIPLLGALFAMATTRAQFLSLILGRPVDENFITNSIAHDGYRLVNEIQDEDKDRRFLNAVSDSLSEVIAKSARNEESGVSVMHWIEKIQKNITQLFRLASGDGEGNGGPLYSEESYRLHRDLFLSGRVTGIAVDLADKVVLSIRSALIASGLPLSVMYISNVEGWNEVPERISYFYRNLRRMAEIGNPLLISSLYVRRPMAFDMKSYLKRAMPFDSNYSTATSIGYSFRPLRYYILAGKVKGWTWQETLAKLKEYSISGLAGILIADFWRIVGEGPLSWQEAHEKLMKESRSYSESSNDAQQMFLLSMADMGAVLMPYPVVSRRPELLRFYAGNRRNGRSSSPGSAISGFMPSPSTPMPPRLPPTFNGSGPYFYRQMIPEVFNLHPLRVPALNVIGAPLVRPYFFAGL